MKRFCITTLVLLLAFAMYAKDIKRPDSYNYMRAEQIYRDEQGLSLMPHTAQPVLPAQNQALPPEVRAFLNAGRTR